MDSVSYFLFWMQWIFNFIGLGLLSSSSKGQTHVWKNEAEGNGFVSLISVLPKIVEFDMWHEQGTLSWPYSTEHRQTQFHCLQPQFEALKVWESLPRESNNQSLDDIESSARTFLPKFFGCNRAFPFSPVSFRLANKSNSIPDFVLIWEAVKERSESHFVFWLPVWGRGKEIVFS